MITLNGISKTFESSGKVVHAVQDVNLEIREKDIFGIIGFSGAGKSTLVRCINLLERPTEGSVEIAGVDLTKLSPKELRGARKKIGMIFQHFNLMPSRTIAGNVAYPLKGSGLSKKEIQEKVTKLLTLVGIEDKANAYPSQLSGGQKQRVAIARALANDPDILLCDEATSALDPQTTRSILKLLKQLNEELGLTIVVITHEMAVVKEICNRVAVMEGGRVVESGDVYSIFASPKEELTKNFIRSTSNVQKIHELIEDNAPQVTLCPGEKIVRLRYRSKITSDPVISDVARKYNVSVSIILANVDVIQGAPIGDTVAKLSGDGEALKQAIQYFEENGVSVEVIRDAELC